MSLIERIDPACPQNEKKVQDPYLKLLDHAKRRILANLANAPEWGDWNLSSGQESLIVQCNVLEALHVLQNAATPRELLILKEHPLLIQAEQYQNGEPDAQKAIEEYVESIVREELIGRDLFVRNQW